MVLEWTLEPTPGWLQHQSTSQGNMGDSEPPAPHQTFCVSLVLVSFTLIYRAAHSTIITSEERDSKLPVTGYLRTKGQESVYETCACVIHTILLSYMCINIVSHITLMFARGTCAS